MLTDVVNTLIFKVEASGDSDTSELKYKNLLVELEKKKFEDIRKNKELDEMRHIVETLRKEVLELKDKLDEVELDRQKERGR